MLAGGAFTGRASFTRALQEAQDTLLVLKGEALGEGALGGDDPELAPFRWGRRLGLGALVGGGVGGCRCVANI
jgi:hypothetical protein